MDSNNKQQPLYWLLQVGGNELHCKFLKWGIETTSGYDHWIATNDDFISIYEFGENRVTTDEHGKILSSRNWFNDYYNYCLKKKLETGKLVLYDKDKAPHGNIYIGTAKDPLIGAVYGDEGLLDANGKQYHHSKKFVIKRSSAIKRILMSAKGERGDNAQDYFLLMEEAAVSMGLYIQSLHAQCTEAQIKKAYENSSKVWAEKMRIESERAHLADAKVEELTKKVKQLSIAADQAKVLDKEVKQLRTEKTDLASKNDTLKQEIVAKIAALEAEKNRTFFESEKKYLDVFQFWGEQFFEAWDANRAFRKTPITAICVNARELAQGRLLFRVFFSQRFLNYKNEIAVDGWKAIFACKCMNSLPARGELARFVKMMNVNTTPNGFQFKTVEGTSIVQVLARFAVECMKQEPVTSAELALAVKNNVQEATEDIENNLETLNEKVEESKEMLEVLKDKMEESNENTKEMFNALMLNMEKLMTNAKKKGHAADSDDSDSE